MNWRNHITELVVGPVVALAVMVGHADAQFSLLLLHGANGRDIRLNGHEVTRLHAAIPGQPNKEFTNGIKCLVFTTDAKVASVVESCEDVSRMIDKAKTRAVS